MSMYFLSILSLFITVMPFNLAYADKCDELQNEVMGIEYKLKTTQLNACSDENPTNCCKKDDGDSCKNLYQAELDYNSALAKVNMIESLVAISHAIDTNHNALRKLEPEQLETAEVLVDNFLNNFSKANVLNKSLEFFDVKGEKDGKNFWTGYNGESVHDLNTYLIDKCKDKDFKNFCDEYNKVIASGRVTDEDMLKTLSNFAKADKRINYDLGERYTNYKDYKKYFKVNINNDVDKAVTIDKFLDGEEIKKVEALKEKISEYKKTKSKESATAILTLSKKLQKIQMNFDQNVVLSESVTASTRKDFERDIVNVSTVAGAMLNRNLVNDNLKATSKSLNIEIQNKESFFLKDFKENTTIAEVCPNSTTSEIAIKCIRELCSEENGKCTQTETNKDLFAVGLQGLYNDAKRLDDAKTLEKANIAMLSCMNEKDPSVQLTCLEKHKKSLVDANLIKDGLQGAKEELKKTLKTLNYIKAGEPIKELRLSKYMGLNALEIEDCTTEDKKIHSNEIKSYCDTPALDTHTSSAVSLSNDMNSIMVTFDQDKLNNLQSSLYDDDNKNFNKYYVELMDRCDSKNKIDYLCKFYEGEKSDIQKKKDDAIAAAKRAQQYKEESLVRAKNRHAKFKYKENKATMSGAGYAAAGLVQGITQNMGGIFGTMMQKRQHDRQMKQYQNLYSYQSLMYSENTVHNTNWYNWNYDQVDPTGFNSTGVNYLDTNALSFDFNPIPFSYTANGGQTYIPPVSTGTTTGTNFNFSN